MKKKQPEYHIGMHVIGDMSKEDLVEEIIIGQRERLMECGRGELRNMVVNTRLEGIKNRLLNEAGVIPGPLGILGMIHQDEEDE